MNAYPTLFLNVSRSTASEASSSAVRICRWGRTVIALLLTAGAAAALIVPTPASAASTLTNLATFNNSNGANPFGGLLLDAAGNLYGTTQRGGAAGHGTLYEIDAATHTLTTLANFQGTDGDNSQSKLLMDAGGNLYGTTYSGGSSNQGTVFELSAGSHTVMTLAAFDGANGANPWSGLVADAAGNLYGTTTLGGASNQGTVYQIAAGSRAMTTLTTFNGANGSNPQGALLADAAGNLYGTTSLGGANNKGTIYQLAVGSRALSTLTSFNGANGTNPYAELIADAAGNLYGTTRTGGSGSGSVFQLAAGSNVLTTLASFNGLTGSDVYAGLIADAAGNLFGGTVSGGARTWGNLFRVAAGTNAITSPVTFDGGNGGLPYSSLIADGAGTLYGTSNVGGPGSSGTVFELTGAGFVTPEPSSIVLLAFAAGSLALRRRRKEA